MTDKYTALRLRKSKKLSRLHEQMEDAEARMQDAEQDMHIAERQIEKLEAELKNTPRCVRCRIRVTPDPNTGGVCCPYCGYCEMVAAGDAGDCEYHRSRELSGSLHGASA